MKELSCVKNSVCAVLAALLQNWNVPIWQSYWQRYRELGGRPVQCIDPTVLGREHTHALYRKLTLLWLGYCVDDPGFDSRQGQEICLFSKTSRSHLGSINPGCYSVGTAALYLGVNRLCHECATTPPSSAKGKGSYTTSPPIRPHGAYRETLPTSLHYTIHSGKWQHAWGKTFLHRP